MSQIVWLYVGLNSTIWTLPMPFLWILFILEDRSPEVGDVEGLTATKHLELPKEKDKAEASFIEEYILGKLRMENNRPFPLCPTLGKIPMDESFTYTLIQRKCNKNQIFDTSIQLILYLSIYIIFIKSPKTFKIKTNPICSSWINYHKTCCTILCKNMSGIIFWFISM